MFLAEIVWGNLKKLDIVVPGLVILKNKLDFQKHSIYNILNGYVALQILLLQ